MQIISLSVALVNHSAMDAGVVVSRENCFWEGYVRWRERNWLMVWVWLRGRVLDLVMLE